MTQKRSHIADFNGIIADQSSSLLINTTFTYWRCCVYNQQLLIFTLPNRFWLVIFRFGSCYSFGMVEYGHSSGNGAVIMFTDCAIWHDILSFLSECIHIRHTFKKNAHIISQLGVVFDLPMKPSFKSPCPRLPNYPGVPPELLHMNSCS